MKDHEPERPRAPATRWSLLITGLVLLGLFLRIYKAWTIQFSPDSDHGIIFLMAKHMALGIDFPAFFYGQPYMGSLEPALSALICRMFGISSFHVCLGTVLAGIALLPLIYLWGRDAGGRYAGLAALLLSVVGSLANFHYSVAPRGGYAAMMACGAGTLYLACRIVTQTKAGQSVHLSLYILLGLLAGLGWWANQLMVAFLLATVMVLLLGVSWRLIREGTLPALLSFFAGSAFWWTWNATHAWQTFDFNDALGRLPIKVGLWAFSKTFLSAIDRTMPQPCWGLIVMGVMSCMALLFLVRLAHDAIRRRESDRIFFRLAAPLLILSIASVSMTSKYLANDVVSRYVLPALPPLAIMLGWSVGWLMERRLAWLGWILLAIVMPTHLFSILDAKADLEFGRQAWARVAPIVQTVVPLCDGLCYGDYEYHWLNFASGEKLCMATAPWERYAPYGRRVELADRPAFLNNYNNLHSFLAYSGGHSLETNVAGVHVDYALTPPPNDWRYLDNASIVEMCDAKGLSHRTALTDGTLHTSWNVSLKANETAELSVEFNQPYPVCGLRFVSQAATPPGFLQIEVQPASTTNWQEVLPWTAPRGYFWSGPHLKLEGLQTFEEIRFACPTGGMDRLRIKFGLADSRPRNINLDEILFLERASPPEGSEPTVQKCLDILKQHGIQQFRGPRWMTERLAARDTGAMKLIKPGFITRSVQDLPKVDSSRADKLVFSEKTGLLMDARDVARSRIVLGKCRLEWKEIPLGSLTLMVVQKATARNDGTQLTPVFWTEQGCFAEAPARIGKKRAELVFQKAMAQKDHGANGPMIALLTKALSLYDYHQPARRALATALQASGRQAESDAQAVILSKQTLPDVAGQAVYPQGLQFLGVTLSTNSVAPGQSFDITYFWKCPPSVTPSRYAMFVNFQKEKERFQDDHILMEDLLPENIEYQPFDEVFSYNHHLMVPATASTWNPADRRWID